MFAAKLNDAELTAEAVTQGHDFGGLEVLLRVTYECLNMVSPFSADDGPERANFD